MDDPKCRAPQIALVHYSAPPVAGGVEKVILGQARALTQSGWDVLIVAGAGGDFDHAQNDDVTDQSHLTLPLLSCVDPTILEFNAKLFKDSVKGEISDSTMETFHRLSHALVLELDQALQDVDVVFVHNLLTMPFHPVANHAMRRWIDLVDKKSKRPKIVGWIHDLGALDERYAPWHELSQKFGSPWDAYFFPIPSVHWVAVSSYQAERARTLWDRSGKRQEVRVVRNGMDLLEEISASERLAMWLKQQEWESRSLILFHPARLIPRKNVGFSLEVLRSLKEKNHPATRHLLLIGSGAYDFHLPASRSERERLRTLTETWNLEKNVGFVGDSFELSDEEIRALYRLSDCVLFPSLSEGFGLPIIECLAHGKTIFFPNQPPMNELAHDLSYAYDAHATADEVALQILNWLESPSGRASVIAKRHYLDQITWKTHLTLASQLLKDTLP